METLPHIFNEGFVNGEIAFMVNDSDGKTCNILDANGKKIGNVHDSYKGVSCAIYCMQNNMEMKNHNKIKH